MDPLQVIPLSAADVHRYRALMLEAYDAAPDAFLSTREERAEETEAWWLRRVADASGTSRAFGAVRADELVGASTIEFSTRAKTRHKARLIGMYVRDSHRGQGAGTALVRAALAAAEARCGVRLVTLTVTEGNTAAIRIYERAGFRAFGVEPLAIATPSGLLGKVHMWRPVGDAAAS